MKTMTPLEKEVKHIFEYALKQTANQSNLHSFHHLLQQCHERLQQPMRVAIVGLIKAGKSTLMNAILGEKLVATGAVEATFNINCFKYGKTSSLKVYFKDNRPPEEKSFSELQSLTLRAEKYQDYLLQIKYIEIFYPNEILRIFNIIDTPGLSSFFKEDSQNTQDFLNLHGQELTEITQQQTAQADAVLYLFSQGIGQGDLSTVQEFQGSLLGHATPINAIGVLTKVDNYASDDNVANPIAASQRIIKRLSENPDIRRHFYAIRPICGLLAEGAQTLTPEQFDTLTELAKLPEEVFEEICEYASNFSENNPDVSVSGEKRVQLQKHLGLYGVVVAYGLLKSGVNSREELIVKLLQNSGILELRQLILSHFGHRAFLIKLGKVFQEIFSYYHQKESHLKGADLLVLQEITGKFEALADNEHAFLELKVLRNYYEGKLSFTIEEGKELLQVTGEDGNFCGTRLGLPEKTTIEEMIAMAQKRISHWQQRVNDPMRLDRPTLEAARILNRSYERILIRLQKAKEYLYV